MTKSTTLTDGPRSLDDWDDLIGQRIADAMKDGAFDNLPGAGKPMKKQGNPYAGENELAYDILANNDLAPNWITERQAVAAAIAKLRSTMKRQAEWHSQEIVHVADENEQLYLRGSWQRLIQRWTQEIADLNKRINALNVEQPIAHLEIFKLRLEDELAAVGVAREI